MDHPDDEMSHSDKFIKIHYKHLYIISSTHVDDGARARATWQRSGGVLGHSRTARTDRSAIAGRPTVDLHWRLCLDVQVVNPADAKPPYAESC